MTDLAFRYEAQTRMNWSRWVIDCGGPGCLSALEVKPPGPPVVDRYGRVLFHPTWGAASMRCWDCDWVTTRIDWPADPFAIEAILFMRPDEKTRNWTPGETLDALLLENIAHGIMPPEHMIGGSEPLMVVNRDDVLVGGSLMSALPEFEAVQRLHEIEGGESDRLDDPTHWSC